MSEAHADSAIGTRRPEDVIYRLELEDRGQDLTTLHVIDGIIVYCGPLQRLNWEGRKLTAKEFAAGNVLVFADDGSALNYMVIGVKKIEHELTYKDWLAEVDRLAWEQWSDRDYTAKAGANKPGDPWIEIYLDGESPADAWTEEVSASGE